MYGGGRDGQRGDTDGEHYADEVTDERPLPAAHQLRDQHERRQDDADHDAAGDEPGETPPNAREEIGQTARTPVRMGEERNGTHRALRQVTQVVHYEKKGTGNAAGIPGEHWKCLCEIYLQQIFVLLHRVTFSFFFLVAMHCH